MSDTPGGRVHAPPAAIETPDARAHPRATLIGVSPVLAVLLVLAGLLWGAGYQLPLVEVIDSEGGEINGRQAVAWFCGTLLAAAIVALALPSTSALLRGEFRGRLIGGRFRGRAEGHRTALQGAITELEGDRVSSLPEPSLGAHPLVDPRTSLLNTSLNLTFPLMGPVRATALGNVLAAVGDRVLRRYGLDLRVAWNRLFAVLPKDAREVVAALERRRDGAISLAAGSLLGTVIALPLVGVYVTEAPIGLLAPAATAILARRAYRSSVDAALEHGRAVEAAVDVYVDQLLEAMHLPRPVDRAEQRERCIELSQMLAVPGVVTETYRASVGEGAAASDAVLDSVERSVGDAVSRALGGALERRVGTTVSAAVHSSLPGALSDTLPAAVDDTLPRAVRATLPKAIDESVGPAVSRGVERAIAGPALTNFDGWLIVEVVERRGDSIVISQDRELVIRAGPNTVQVSIMQGSLAESPGHGLQVPLRITGGEDRAVVTFEIVLDSDQRTLRQAPKEIVVQNTATGAEKVAFEIDVTMDAGEDAWLWVRVLQSRRLIQTLDLHLSADSEQ